MPGPWQIFGQYAETMARKHLEQRGYQIIETNFRTRFAEIDIIARHNDYLVFVEVKARKTDRKGSPREAVFPAKQKKICIAAAVYLRQLNRPDVRVRFDVVAVQEQQGQLMIDVIENAFQAV